MMETMKEILNEADSASVLMIVNGKEVYTFEDAQKLNKAELMEQKATGKQPEIADRIINPDGLTYAASNIKRTAIDPNTFFENRYRKTGGKAQKYEVVTDYRAIKEQASGQVYTNMVISYVIGKDEAGEYAVTETKTISAEEFVSDFKRKLDVESMIKVTAAIGKLENTGMEADKLEL